MTDISKRLDGKVCVIAGAAGVIGEAICRRLAREGGIVVGIDREKKHTVGSINIEADLAVESEVAEVFAQVYRQTGRIDVLYNNSGLVLADDKSALTTSTDTLDRIFADNFRTTWLCCKHGIGYMLKAERPNGSVINSSSFLAGMGAASAQMAYNAAKAAVTQLSRDLGTHLARQGIRVNSLALGPIATPQLDAAFAQIGPDERDRRFQHMPFGRFGSLDELAGTIAYLASDDAGFVTASSFPIDGGIQAAFTVPANR
jgi:NAD(P)-dependent dehydrogenase (short-subunit alcohol dehydrogenase family)